MQFEKTHVINSFSKSAKTYDQHAFIQKEIGKRLLSRLSVINFNPSRILDVGAGTGHLTRQIQQKFPKSQVYGLDLAQGMTHFAKSTQPWHLWQNSPNYIQADMEVLPIQSQSIDLIFSNFTLQWAVDVKKTLAEFKRVLKPNGLLFFSTVGPLTLFELRSSWQTIDDKTHVNDFIDMHDYGDFLFQEGFIDPVMDMELVTVEYKCVKALLKDLKATGARNMNMTRPKGLTPKRHYHQMIKAYERFKQPNNQFPATFEIIYGHAWQPQLSLMTSSKDGLFRISGDRIPLLSEVI